MRSGRIPARATSIFIAGFRESLRVRGSGQVRLFFASEYVHTNYPEESGADPVYVPALRMDAHRHSRDSLLPPPTSSAAADSVRWPRVSGSVSHIGVGTWAKAGETVHLQVDDIRIYGVPYTPVQVRQNMKNLLIVLAATSPDLCVRGVCRRRQLF